MKAIESIVYKCDYCPTRFLTQSECFDHENSCQFKPVVYPKIEFVKCAKSKFDTYWVHDDENETIHNWLDFRIGRPSGSRSYPKDVYISLKSIQKHIWLETKKYDFVDYFIINNNLSKEIPQYEQRNNLTKKIFSIDNEFNEDYITLLEFDFGKLKLEIEYADGTKIRYSDFYAKGETLEIPIYPDNDIVILRLIEKILKPKKLAFKESMNTCYSECPYIPKMFIGSHNCWKCKHNVGEEKQKVLCNYEEDTKE